MKESDIVFEKGQHWVLKVRKGFEIYKLGVTHSTRVGQIGYTGEEGLRRAVTEVERREQLRGA